MVPASLTKSLQTFRDGISSIWQKSQKLEGLQPGLYHYKVEQTGEESRIHLRVDENMDGILIVNANRILHLNQTAVVMAYLYLEEYPSNKAVEYLWNQFDIPRSQAISDYADFCDQIRELTRPDGACPIHELDIETTVPFSSLPSAPYRMDLALTYRCNNDCSHCYNARPRDFGEISTSQWIQIIDKLWEIGIPHLVFTGGEPTLRSDLPELIQHAEQNGQITGINTNGRRLSDQSYVKTLIDAGLDHIQITLESHIPEIHDRMVRNKGSWSQTIRGIQNVLDTRLYVMTNTTLLNDNVPYLEETLEYLGKLRIPTIGLNALIHSGHGLTVDTGLKESELLPLLDIAQLKTNQYKQKLIWYTPTQYCHFDPVQLELGVKGCTAALYNMCIEPNGDVLPCQSYYQSLGNILVQDWKSIWNHPLASNFRNRKFAPEECHECAFFVECGGGCPLSFNSKMPEIKPF